jgi:hypothetical protein
MVKSNASGNVSMLANIEHQKIPITLTEGFTFPDLLESHSSKLYRFLDIDNEPFYIML